jgi:hypothetical protein
MNRVCSIFSQILQLTPRPEFEAAVRKHTRTGIQQLDAIHVDAVLPVGTRPDAGERSPAVWQPAKASYGIWAWMSPRSGPR